MKNKYQVWLILEKWNEDKKISEEMTTLYAETKNCKKAEEIFNFIDEEMFEKVRKKYKTGF